MFTWSIYLNWRSKTYMFCLTLGHTFQIWQHSKLTTKLYDKCADYNFSIVNVPFLSRNIPIHLAKKLWHVCHSNCLETYLIQGLEFPADLRFPAFFMSPWVISEISVNSLRKIYRGGCHAFISAGFANISGSHVCFSSLFVPAFFRLPPDRWSKQASPALIMSIWIFMTRPNLMYSHLWLAADVHSTTTVANQI